MQRILPRHAATFDVSELRDPSHGEHGAGTMVEAVDGPRGTFGIQLIQAYPSRQHQRQHKGQAPRARREGGRRAGVGQNAIVELHTSRRRVEQLAAAKLPATVLERRWSRHKLFYAGGRDHVTSRHVVMVGRGRGQPRRTAPPPLSPSSSCSHASHRRCRSSARESGSTSSPHAYALLIDTQHTVRSVN